MAKFLIFQRYDFFKQVLLSQALPVFNWRFEDALPVHLVSSCAAAVFATSKLLPCLANDHCSQLPRQRFVPLQMS